MKLSFFVQKRPYIFAQYSRIAFLSVTKKYHNDFFLTLFIMYFSSEEFYIVITCIKKIKHV